MRFDRVESFFCQYEHGHFLARSDPCIPVLASKRLRFASALPTPLLEMYLRPHSPLALAPHFSHVRVSLSCCPGQATAACGYSSQVPQAAIPTTSGPLKVSRGGSIPSNPAAALASSTTLSPSSASHTKSSKVKRTGRRCLLQTPSLSWLRLHLSAHPQGMFLHATISLPRVTSELAALTLLCTPSLFRRSCVRNVSYCSSLPFFHISTSLDCHA